MNERAIVSCFRFSVAGEIVGACVMLHITCGIVPPANSGKVTSSLHFICTGHYGGEVHSVKSDISMSAVKVLEFATCREHSL